jgi:hypothetical protein
MSEGDGTEGSTTISVGAAETRGGEGQAGSFDELGHQAGISGLGYLKAGGESPAICPDRRVIGGFQALVPETERNSGRLRAIP